MGPAVPLPSGAPRDSCEANDWHDLAPARVQAQASDGVYSYSQEQRGFGVFQSGSDEPQELEPLWSRMGQPALQEEHNRLGNRVHEESLTAVYWSVGGLVALFGGVGAAAALQSESGVAAGVVGVTGLVLGLVGAFGALVAMPSAADQLDADARETLFFSDEDDMDAVKRGVDRLNATRRKHCESLQRRVNDVASSGVK